MKAKLSLLSKHYLDAMRDHLNQGDASDLKLARSLGERAKKYGLETLDLARVHEEALEALVLPQYSVDTGDELIRRCVAFFAEAVTPIEETHRGAREANAHLKVMIEALTQRTMQLAASNRELTQEVKQRRVVEETLRASEETTSELLGKSRQLQDELRLLSRRLLTVQEDEQKRISRALHDVVAQTLTGINVRLAALKFQSHASAKELHEKIADTQRLVQESVEIVHRFARDLRPTVLDDLGLIPALESRLKTFMEQSGVRVSLTAFAGVEEFDNAAKTVMYRVVQEALVNVERHAKASRVAVSIRGSVSKVSMEITDNGPGFNVDESSDGQRRKGLGLIGMRERVEMIGGRFWIESAVGQSTTVHVELPQPVNLPKERILVTTGKNNP